MAKLKTKTTKKKAMSKYKHALSGQVVEDTKSFWEAERQLREKEKENAKNKENIKK